MKEGSAKALTDAGARPTEQRRTLRLSRIEVSNPRMAGKVYRLKADTGEVASRTRGWIVAGRVWVEEVFSAEDFIALRNAAVAGSTVFAYGLPDRDVPEEGLPVFAESSAPHGALTRTRKDFGFRKGEPAVMLFDYDPEPGGRVLSRVELVKVLTDAAPGLAHCQMVWCCSSSSYIYRTGEQEPAQGLRGQRLYVFVEDGDDIPRAAKALQRRLWLKGHGWIKISANGAQLEKTAVDGSVFQPERVDYVGGAFCLKGLEQRMPEPVLINPEGRWLAESRSVFPSTTGPEEAEACQVIEGARRATEDEAGHTRAQWIQGRLEEAALDALGEGDWPPEEIEAKVLDLKARGQAGFLDRIADAAMRASSTGDEVRVNLPPSFVIHFGHGTSATVAEIVADPKSYDRKPCCDPAEPEYRDWHLAATILGRRIKSHAHGLGVIYHLDDDPTAHAAGAILHTGGWREPFPHPISDEEYRRLLGTFTAAQIEEANRNASADGMMDQVTAWRAEKRQAEEDAGFAQSDSWEDRLARASPPPMVLPYWLPRGLVSSLYGVDGVGKNTLAMLLGLSLAMGRGFLGQQVERPMKVLFIGAEDIEAAIVDRYNRIMAFLQPDAEERALAGLNFQMPEMMQEEVEMATFDGDGRMELTEFARKLERRVASKEIDLLILDPISDLFAGNENDRVEVTRFLKALNQIADRLGVAVLLLGHPSKGQESTYSGSTAWSAKVRSRWWLFRDDKDEVTILSHQKTSYGKLAEPVSCIWDEAHGVLAPLGFAEQRQRNALRLAVTRDLILKGIDVMVSRQMHPATTVASRNHWLPRFMVTAGLNDGRSEESLAAAIEELLADGSIEVVTFDGEEGRPRFKNSDGLRRGYWRKEKAAADTP